ncbi:ATP-binding protein [Agromyces neolithicus]
MTPMNSNTSAPSAPAPSDESGDDEIVEFVDLFRRFLAEVVNRPRASPAESTPLGALVMEHLGEDFRGLPVITESMPPHRLADADLALDAMSASGSGRLLGVDGGQARGHMAFIDLLVNPHQAFSPGPVDYVTTATGPSTERRSVAFGVRLLVHDGSPVAVLQRGSAPEHGRDDARLEIIASTPSVADTFLADLRRLMLELSVLRGKVVTIGGTQFGRAMGMTTFVERPEVAEDQLVLEPETLESVVRHVVDLGDQRNVLRGLGLHLKRGLLLYGPPGTGKTLTVRHLLSRTPGTTAVLLNGPSIGFISMAAEIARAMQPAIVVLEDVDLVANDRSIAVRGNSVLFTILDALDGLEGDADVTFILTTNRVEVLERALADRPGRIDLAAEIPLPDQTARRRLFRLYGRGLPFSERALEAAADRAEGTTGSFAKELMRRAVLTAAVASRPAVDDDLSSTLETLLSDRSDLTRKLLVGGVPAGTDGRHPMGPGGPVQMEGGGISFGYIGGA